MDADGATTTKRSLTKQRVCTEGRRRMEVSEEERRWRVALQTVREFSPVDRSVQVEIMKYMKAKYLVLSVMVW